MGRGPRSNKWKRREKQGAQKNKMGSGRLLKMGMIGMFPFWWEKPSKRRVETCKRGDRDGSPVGVSAVGRLMSDMRRTSLPPCWGGEGKSGCSWLSYFLRDVGGKVIRWESKKNEVWSGIWRIWKRFGRAPVDKRHTRWVGKFKNQGSQQQSWPNLGGT